MQYNGKSLEDMWKYLDEVESLYQDTFENENFDSFNEMGDVFDIMQEIGQSFDGLESLVERYSGTMSTGIFTYLVGTVGTQIRHAITGNINLTIKPDQFFDKLLLDKTIPLFFKLLTNLRWLTMTPHRLSHLASLLEMQIESGYWKIKPFPPIVHNFLQRCLTIGWMNDARAEFAQLAAIDVLNRMCQTGILENNFDAVQIRWFQDKVNQLAVLKADDNGFKISTVKFLSCGTNRKIKLL